ncbi:MAG TPA: hypothetical protein VGD77_06655 [Gemmatimonadaceae bacterium]
MPILRAMPAVLEAVGDLPGPVQAAMIPLFELQPPDLDPVTQQPRQTVDRVLAMREPQIARAWRDATPPRLDLGLLDSPGRTAGPTHELTTVLDAARQRGRSLVPVTAPGRSPAYEAAVRQAIQQDGLGVCFRVPIGVFADPARAAQLLVAECQRYGLRAADADLVVDARSIRRNLLSSTQAQRWVAALAAVPTPNDWRTLVIAGTAKPAGISAVRELQLTGNARIATARLARTEWAAWLGVRAAYARAAAAPRMPWFGDYALGHPDYRPFDARVIRSVAQIWYAVGGTWLVYRGQQVNDVGVGQFRRMAADLLALSEFRGATFSEGDLYISDVATRVRAPGQAGEWRRAGTSHHLTETVDQLATLPPGP